MTSPLNMLDPAHRLAFDILSQCCLHEVYVMGRNPGMNVKDALWLLREKGLIRRNGEKGRKKGWAPTPEGWACSGVDRTEAGPGRGR